MYTFLKETTIGTIDLISLYSSRCLTVILILSNCYIIITFRVYQTSHYCLWALYLLISIDPLLFHLLSVGLDASVLRWDILKYAHFIGRRKMK
jgi:hypothetical protein